MPVKAAYRRDEMSPYDEREKPQILQQTCLNWHTVGGIAAVLPMVAAVVAFHGARSLGSGAEQVICSLRDAAAFLFLGARSAAYPLVTEPGAPPLRDGECGHAGPVSVGSPDLNVVVVCRISPITTPPRSRWARPRSDDGEDGCRTSSCVGRRADSENRSQRHGHDRPRVQAVGAAVTLPWPIRSACGPCVSKDNRLPSNSDAKVAVLAGRRKGHGEHFSRFLQPPGIGI